MIVRALVRATEAKHIASAIAMLPAPAVARIVEILDPASRRREVRSSRSAEALTAPADAHGPGVVAADDGNQRVERARCSCITVRGRAERAGLGGAVAARELRALAIYARSLAPALAAPVTGLVAALPSPRRQPGVGGMRGAARRARIRSSTSRASSIGSRREAERVEAELASGRGCAPAGSAAARERAARTVGKRTRLAAARHGSTRHGGSLRDALARVDALARTARARHDVAGRLRGGDVLALPRPARYEHRGDERARAVLRGADRSRIGKHAARMLVALVEGRGGRREHPRTRARSDRRCRWRRPASTSRAWSGSTASPRPAGSRHRPSCSTRSAPRRDLDGSRSGATIRGPRSSQEAALALAVLGAAGQRGSRAPRGSTLG